MRKNQFFAISLFILLVLVDFSGAYADEYTVKKGDSFWKISEKLNVSFTEIKQLNRDRLKFTNNFNRIFPGQVFLIPASKAFKRDAKIVPTEKVVKNDTGVAPAVKVAKKEILEAPAARVPAVGEKQLQEETAKPTAIFTDQLEKEITDKNLQQGHDLASTLDERHGRIIKSITLIVGFVTFLATFFWLYPHFRPKRKSVLTSDVEKTQDVEEFFAELKIKNCSSQFPQRILVGYLTRGENNKGYFLLDLSANGSVDIGDIKTLAEVAIEGYGENVKSRIDYDGLLSPEMISKWGAEEGEARPLRREEVLEFERIVRC